MNRRNYQKELDELLASFSEKKRLFLHCCCAPCSSYVLEYLHDFFDITVFFYNPNISEESGAGCSRSGCRRGSAPGWTA